MADGSQLGARLRFSVFELNVSAGELRKNGLRIRLQEQPIRVLTMLVERPGDVVTREELQQRLWPADTFVDFDHGLNKAINKIRDALGDSAESPRFIETVPRRGYRFLAEVKPVNGTAVTSSASAIASQALTATPDPIGGSDAPSQAVNRPARWKIPIVALLVIVTLFVVWKYHAFTSARSPVIRSLAVLPIESLSNEPSQDYFADGITEQLISDLGQISALRVISRTSAMTYKNAHKPLPQIARELKVDAVIEGTVFHSGDQVRITAQLIDASSDKNLWSQSYEGAVKDTLALQSRVAQAIADQIRVNLNEQEQAALKNAKVVNPQAYESYLKGRFFWNKRTADGLKVALAYFNQAIDEDPKYAPAYSGLSDTYALLGDWQYAVMTPKEALPKAKAAANNAIALDNSLGEAHNSLAFCLDGFDWDFNAGEKEFQQALKLNPGYATAHHWYAQHLALVNRYDEAIAEMKKAESLDPLSLIIQSDLAELLVLAHAYDESIAQSQKAIEMDPNFAMAHNQLAQAYLQKHMLEPAVAQLQTAVQLSNGSPTCVANLGRAYAASGKKSEALQQLNELKSHSNATYSHGSEIATVYAALGDSNQAILWLEKAYEERFNPGVLLRPGFDPLRPDPRFQDIVRRVGLPQ
jgi:TolB-like protein/DNA-binding winged helix-turn-helix (wHTH) protein/Flp pilus assembly protein TadD